MASYSRFKIRLSTSPKKLATSQLCVAALKAPNEQRVLLCDTVNDKQTSGKWMNEHLKLIKISGR